MVGKIGNSWKTWKVDKNFALALGANKEFVFSGEL